MARTQGKRVRDEARAVVQMSEQGQVQDLCGLNVIQLWAPL